MITRFTCPKGCCNVSVSYYDPENEKKMVEWIREERKQGIRRKKAGIFLYDPERKKILLVQSHGKFWGIAKGTKEENETFVECAVREVREETGIEISEYELTEYVKVGNALYYVYPIIEREVSVQNNVENNDANGVGWFSYDCLLEFVKSGQVVLNKQCRVVAKKVLGINYT